MDITLNRDQVRWLLQNARKVIDHGKCMECEGTGFINWDEWGDNEKPGKTSDPDREWDHCDKCNGIGYIW